MKVIIDIEEGRYNWIMSHASNNPNDYANTTDIVFRKAVESGKVLPKEHGDLIDRDELKRHSCGGDYDGCGGFTPEYISLSDINDAPVVIPAARITESSETMGDL